MALRDHCLEYTVVLGLQIGNPPMVYGTENMTDLDILHYLRATREVLRPEAQYKLTHSDLSSSAMLLGVVFVRYLSCWICKEPSPCHVLELYGTKG
jgi:hypothetical protein